MLNSAWVAGATLMFFVGMSVQALGQESFCDQPVKRIYKTMTDFKTGGDVQFVYFGLDEEGKESLGFCWSEGSRDTVFLKETLYRYDVSIEDRTIILEDTQGQGPLIGFATAPGGLDVEGQMSVTPLFKNAWLDKATAIKNRFKPSYFHGHPFIRVMIDKSVAKGWTGIGLHIKQNPHLRRTYDSHGCLRLVYIDLIIADRILRYGVHRHLPINVWHSYRPEGHEDLEVSRPELHYADYQKERNFGTDDHPVTRRGKSGLVIFERIYSNPPQLFSPNLEME